jgi:hypothetical protein
VHEQSKGIIMKKIITIALLVSIFANTAHAANQSSKERLSYFTGRTTVYVYNPVEKGNLGHVLRESFSVTSNGQELAEDRYYPANGEMISLQGPTPQNKSGITVAAEFGRDRGITKGTTYLFTERIYLDGIDRPITLKQRVTGTTFTSTMHYGIAIPQNGTDEWFDEDNSDWHEYLIPHMSSADTMLGTYRITCRAYKSSLSTTRTGETSPTIRNAAAVAAGLGAVATIGAGASVIGNTEQGGVLEGPRHIREADGSITTIYPNRNRAEGIISSAGVVTIGLAALTYLASLIPSLNADIIYKIEYLPVVEE